MKLIVSGGAYLPSRHGWLPGDELPDGTDSPKSDTAPDQETAD